MPVPLIAAGVMAVGSIGGAILSSHAQKSAANQANQAQQQATQAQLQLGRESLGQNLAIYNSNYGVLSPYASRGNVAGDSINAMLGLPAAPTMQSPLASTAMSSGAVPAPSAPNTQFPTSPGVPAGGIMTPSGQPITAQTFGTQGAGPAAYRNALGTMGAGDTAIGGMNRLGTTLPTGAGAATGAALPAHPVTATPGVPAPATGTAAPAANALSPSAAFNNFANSAGMQFAEQQGANAINQSAAAGGWLQSGAAMKALQDRNQQIALQNYLFPYMNMLGQQQSVGAGAASSIAGVGQNFSNANAAINAGMGANIQGGADSASAAAIARGNANGQMWGTIGSSLGNLASSFMPVPKPAY